MEIFVDKFSRITSCLKYFQSAAKIFKGKYFWGWINICKILKKFYPWKYVTLQYIILIYR